MIWDVALLANLIFQECVPKYVTGSEACNTTLLISQLASDMGIPQHFPKLFYDNHKECQNIIQRPDTLDYDTISFENMQLHGYITLIEKMR
jgi:hypothetical protein